MSPYLLNKGQKQVQTKVRNSNEYPRYPSYIAFSPYRYTLTTTTRFLNKTIPKYFCTRLSYNNQMQSKYNNHHQLNCRNLPREINSTENQLRVWGFTWVTIKIDVENILSIFLTKIFHFRIVYNQITARYNITYLINNNRRSYF